MYEAGRDFPIEDDAEILRINSPKENVSGPYRVVFKNVEQRWAIVASDWDEDPRLAIRWFWNAGGNPISSGHATWLVVPPSLSRGILSGLPLDHAFSRRIDDFLSRVITGAEL